MSLLAAALFPKAKREVLSLLFSSPDRDFHIREVARTSSLAVGQTQRELHKLERAGVLVRSERGQLVLYRANPSCPIFKELRGIVTKVLATVPSLTKALSSLADEVELAFVYGSVARGEDTSESDIDLMVIGDVKFSAVVAAIRSAQEDLERPVNPTVYPVREWLEKLNEGHHFLTTVASSEKLYIIGDDDVLEELREQRLDSTPSDVEK